MDPGCLKGSGGIWRCHLTYYLYAMISGEEMHPLCKLWIALWLLIYMLEAITPHNGSISTKLPCQFMLLLSLA